MQRIRCLYFLLVISLLLASCQNGSVTTNLNAPILSVVLNGTASDNPFENPIIQPISGAVPEESECLICHSDKELLIETAAPEIAHEESESSGVG